jgi:hypothetical protein
MLGLGIAYTFLVGIPLCLCSMMLGLMMIGVGTLLIASIVFAPVGLAMIAAGITTMALGARYVALDRRQF